VHLKVLLLSPFLNINSTLINFGAIEVEEEKAIEDKLEKESKPLIKVKES
jgi:hypothetical protein